MSRIASKEYEVFKFEELSEEAKNEAKRWYLERQETCIFTDMVIEDLSYNYGLTDLKTEYSLSYCQGDGLCLYGKILFDEIKKNEQMKKIAFFDFTDDDYELLDELEYYESGITLIKRNHHYAHANTVEIEIPYYDGDFENEEIVPKIEKMIEKLLNNIKGWYFETCAKYEKWGYDYFYEISDEDMIEICDANEYEFLENGKHFY